MALKHSLAGIAIACAAATAPALAQDSVLRHPIPGSSFPISQAVEVPGGLTTIYLSGVVPARVAGQGLSSREAFGGDTRGQSRNVLQRIEGQLKALGLTMKDVVKMQVFLVGDSTKGGAMDFDGFMEAYREYYNTESGGNLPARSLFEVKALANPAFLVEVEIVAVRPVPPRPAR